MTAMRPSTMPLPCAIKNCSPAPPPTIRVTQAPKAGSPDNSSGHAYDRESCGLSKDQSARPGGAFYQAHEGYAGPDHVGYEVTNSNGEVGDLDVTITLKAAPTPSPASEKRTRL